MRGDGSQAWVTREQLANELAALREAGGELLYSRDQPEGDPTPIAFDTFELIVGYELPVKLLEDPHPDVANELPGGATSLMAFAYRGQAELARDLLARGAAVDARDARDADGYTALMYATNTGSLEVAEALLSAGADPNAADVQASTPLMFASQHGHLNIVRRLLAAGADPNRRGDHGLTALGFAQQNGHDAVIAALIEAGAT